MRIAIAGLAALTAVAATGACGTATTREATSSSTSASATTEAPHNQTDLMFVHTMTAHHRQAIEMSEMILAKQGIDPRVVALAAQIKAAQGPEIATMQGWMADWGMGGMTGMDHGGMPGMDGMMSQAQMDALRNARGVEASRLFLTGMIAHHRGAIAMSQDEIRNGQNPDAIALATSIIDSQQKEIDAMEQILGTL